ncbi:SDR family NAD(P)-dependent oxidoreductase [Nonomuraea sp. NPDC048901]|uniref:SDR family NAD(P)-dependent oxidoreductase n=1 Tax=unclassified Nonomuraea TaxID=2593643 RepID=UPI0033DD00AE
MSNPVAVITGASGGIGEQIAVGLADAGATVIMVARSLERLSWASERVAHSVPGASIEIDPVDFADLAEVRALAQRLIPRQPSVVVSNAAVIAPLDDRTPAGLHRTLAVNHLAPYLLLRLLAANLPEAARRFIVVGASPRALARVPVDLDDLNTETRRGLGWPPSFRPFVAYARTKNMNTMFVYAMAQRLAGTSTTINGAHPGIIKGTGLSRHDRGALKLFGSTLNLFTPASEAGAQTPLWLATDPAVEGVTGSFFVDRTATSTASHTTDPVRIEALWRESARLVGMPAGNDRDEAPDAGHQG